MNLLSMASVLTQYLSYLSYLSAVWESESSSNWSEREPIRAAFWLLIWPWPNTTLILRYRACIGWISTRAFERRLTRLATTLSFQDNMGKRPPPPPHTHTSQWCFAENVGLTWHIKEQGSVMFFFARTAFKVTSELFMSYIVSELTAACDSWTPWSGIINACLISWWVSSHSGDGCFHIIFFASSYICYLRC